MMYDHDDDHGSTIDPELRLHSVRTAASAIAESIKVEQRQERRAKRKRRFFSFRRKGTGDSQKSKLADTQSVKSGVTTVTEDGKVVGRAGKEEEKKEEIKGSRRNIYVNYPLPAHELDTSGDPLARYPRNKVRTTSEFFIIILLLF
jgi:phospholipid-translocating ATPase